MYNIEIIIHLQKEFYPIVYQTAAVCHTWAHFLYPRPEWRSYLLACAWGRSHGVVYS